MRSFCHDSFKVLDAMQISHVYIGVHTSSKGERCIDLNFSSTFKAIGLHKPVSEWNNGNEGMFISC